MNDEENNAVYDTVQKEGLYELPDQPEEDEVPLYDNIHGGLPESNVSATDLETHEYDSVYVAGGEEKGLTSSQPEAAEYLLPDEDLAQDLHPKEQQEDWGISMEELHSPTQDQEPGPETPPKDGDEKTGALLSPQNFTIRQSRAFFTSNSAADGLEENNPASTHPEISLFVKVLNGHSGSPDQNNLAPFLLTPKYTARLPDLAFHEGGIWFSELQMGKSQLDSSSGQDYRMECLSPPGESSRQPLEAIGPSSHRGPAAKNSPSINRQSQERRRKRFAEKRSRDRAQVLPGVCQHNVRRDVCLETTNAHLSN
ncbi:unnamed protein product [Gulo gulo]|uniref:Uncharacterized protein n=1 Tax=Gulo gulo TaxID=48420 RepID=A0A9X9LD24_GULGU|nr:unnamed protein product [Gulo gulo]